MMVMRWRTREETNEAQGELLLKVHCGGEIPAYQTWSAMPGWMEWLERNRCHWHLIAWMPIAEIEGEAAQVQEQG